MTKSNRLYAMTLIALVFLAIPNMNLIDVLPDCVAYLLFLAVIGNTSRKVPYLAECKAALCKLALITAVKIPAFSVMYSNMRYGADIVPLFTLSFVILELILLYSAISNGYAALSYIGERTDASSVREPFRLNRRRTMTPEALKNFTYIFFLIKGVLNILPELTLLTRDNVSLKKTLDELYPAMLIICIFSSLVLGLVWLGYARKYAKNIRDKNDVSDALGAIEALRERRPEAVERAVKKLNTSLTFIAVCGLFIFDVSFQSLGGYNILPHFIYGLLLFCSMFTFAEDRKMRIALSSFTFLFSVTSILNHLFTSRFFEEYTYAILAYSEPAKTQYLYVEILATFEAVFIIAMLVISALIMIGFIKQHTDVSPSDPSYTKSNKRSHRRLIRVTLPLFILSGLINVMKCVNVFLKSKVTLIESAVNPDGIVASSLPAMNTIIVMLCIIYVIYSFVLASTLKDEVKFKYGKERY